MAGSEWNDKLRSEIPGALANALLQLNRLPHMRYHWPRLFPIRTEMDDFFRGLSPRVIKVLSDMNILESHPACASGYQRPSKFRLVPSALGRNGQAFIPQPIVPPERSSFRYLSSKYPAEAWKGLKSIGVKVLSPDEFLGDVSQFIRSYQTDFQSMPVEWHALLSTALDQLTTCHGSTIWNLRLAPLQDGSWVTPRDGPFISTANAIDLEIPRNTGCHIVHHSVTVNEARKLLIRKFGAEIASKESVCRIITKCHEAKNFNGQDRESISRDDLISHAYFLYRAGWTRGQERCSIWVELEDGSRRLSRETYLEDLAPDSASTLFANHRRSFPFLHRQYLHVFREQGRSWLQRDLELSVLPRLVKPNGDEENFELSPDFISLVSIAPKLGVISLLATRWEEYRKWIVEKGGGGRNRATSAVNQKHEGQSNKETSRQKVRDFISSITVPCRDGGFTTLKNTCLARSDVITALCIPEPGSLAAQGESPHRVLELPNPDSEQWDILAHFGATTKVTIESLIDALQRIKQSMGDDAVPQQVRRVYEYIQVHIERETESKVK